MIGGKGGRLIENLQYLKFPCGNLAVDDSFDNTKLTFTMINSVNYALAMW